LAAATASSSSSEALGLRDSFCWIGFLSRRARFEDEDDAYEQSLAPPPPDLDLSLLLPCGFRLEENRFSAGLAIARDISCIGIRQTAIGRPFFRFLRIAAAATAATTSAFCCLCCLEDECLFLTLVGGGGGGVSGGAASSTASFLTASTLTACCSVVFRSTLMPPLPPFPPFPPLLGIPNILFMACFFAVGTSFGLLLLLFAPLAPVAESTIAADGRTGFTMDNAAAATDDGVLLFLVEERFDEDEDRLLALLLLDRRLRCCCWKRKKYTLLVRISYFKRDLDTQILHL
jgi:hypothetical protein